MKSFRLQLFSGETQRRREQLQGADVQNQLLGPPLDFRQRRAAAAAATSFVCVTTNRYLKSSPIISKLDFKKMEIFNM